MKWNRRRWLAQQVAIVMIALSGTSAVWAVDPPEPPKVSTYAPIEDLTKQVDYYVGRIAQSLASKDDYEAPQQARVVKDAYTLAVLALGVGLHDGESPMKSAAPGLLKGAQSLAKNSANYDEAVKALEELKKSLAQPGQGSPLKWEKVASMHELMKQVPLVHNGLRRGATRLATQAEIAAGHAATIAIIGQASMYDTHEVKQAGDIGKWYEYCAELRDAAGTVNSAIHKGDQKALTESMERLSKSCDTCHATFRKEE